jgi:hypothetical protein
VKYFRSQLRRTWLARLLTLLLVAPYLVWGSPARAQRAPLSVYVLPFNNDTSIGGQLLGRLAADEMALAFSDSPTQAWDIIPQSNVTRRIQELNLQPPFDRVDRVTIANGVDAQAVMYGHITDARVVPDGSTPQASVTIRALIEDINTGELINGAIASAKSTRRMGFNGDADVLLREALGKAAYKAREFMDRFKLPEGTVLNTTVVGSADTLRLDCLLNIGARQGVRRGMEFVVTRIRDVVGRIKVTNVDSDISTARAELNSQGVRPEDRVRAIFNFSDFNTSTSRSGIRAMSESGAATVARADAAAPAEAVAAPRIRPVGSQDTFTAAKARGEHSAQMAQVTVDSPPPVVVDEPPVEGRRGAGKVLAGGAVKMLVGGLLLVGLLALGGRGGSSASRPDSVIAYGYQRDIGRPGAFIKIEWDRPKSIRSSQVLGYVVWRTDPRSEPLVVAGVTGDGPKSFIDHEAARSVTFYDGIPGSDDAGGQTTTADVPGILPGEQYRYQVATAYEEGEEDPDPTNQGGTFMSPLSRSSDWATAISNPGITAPDQGEIEDLRRLRITWTQPLGADSYLIRISRDPTFRDESRGFTAGPFHSVPVEQGGETELTRLIDADRPAVRGGSTRLRDVYISVGAYNSQDDIKPRPFGAIYSQRRFIRGEHIVPDPPGPGSESKPGIQLAPGRSKARKGGPSTPESRIDTGSSKNK